VEKQGHAHNQNRLVETSETFFCRKDIPSNVSFDTKYQVQLQTTNEINELHTNSHKSEGRYFLLKQSSISKLPNSIYCNILLGTLDIYDLKRIER